MFYFIFTLDCFLCCKKIKIKHPVQTLTSCVPLKSQERKDGCCVQYCECGETVRSARTLPGTVTSSSNTTSKLPPVITLSSCSILPLSATVPLRNALDKVIF